MIKVIIDYMDSLPMPVQLTIILGGFFLFFMFIGSIIYKIIKAKKIKAGIVEIDMEVENTTTIPESKTE